MAELATGAVNTLLGVIHNESRRLGRVQGDVLFIQEEMESMKSFLVHLARTRREEHDEQVRTWMNQVRILANDCNNCLDVYLYRGNPDFHRPRRGLRRYLWWGWGFWWLREIIARHHAAGQLRQLKDRARDVGERRLRYGVKVSEAAAGGTVPVPSGQSSSIMSPGAGARGAGSAALAVTVAPSSHLAGAAAEDDDEGDDDDSDGDLVASITAMDGTGTGGGVSTSSTNKVKDYFENRLVRWIRSLETSSIGAAAAPPAPAPAWIGFVLPPGMEEDPEIPRVALAKAQRHFKGWSLLVDIPEVHLEYHFLMPLRPKEILFYILRELQVAANQSQSQSQPQREGWRKQWDIYCDKKKLLRKIKAGIEKMGVDGKIEDISKTVLELGKKMRKGGNKLPQQETIDGDLVLLWKLIISSSSSSSSTTPVAEQQDQAGKKKAIHKAATKLEKHMGVPLDSDDYIRILEEVFTMTTPSTTNAGTGTSVGDEIKEMICMVKDVMQELRECNKPAADSNRENGAAAAADPDRPATDDRQSQEEDAIRKKMKEIKLKIREQLKIKQIMEKIQSNLQQAGGDRIMLILKTHHKYGWEATRNTLSLLGSLGCFAGVAILTTAPPVPQRQRLLLNLNNQRDQPEHMVELSVVGCYLDIVIQHTGKHMHKEKTEIVRDILEECKPHEFCMNIFTQALKANPKRSTEELHKLRSILQATQLPPRSIARKMLEFSYSDLPKEQKSCLLYLAIFPPAPVPQECKIKRSTLVGRWVAEGMITTEDWSWFSSVAKAERCFDVLVDRHFVCPVDIGATGRVKSCTVHPLVHGFITKIAKKQHIVEARLSLHLARHFSIFNDVRLRRSDTILTFLKKNMHDLPQFSKLKVLDLEGCTGIANKGYLKDICSKILMLKYLSLRGTDANHLPREINNLHELEVLDIRQTKIPASATRHVLLLKLKRLLAGGGHSTIDTTGMTQHQQDLLSVEIPGLIEKMIDVEVLSSVTPRRRHDLRDIGSLCQLKKLGVVINKDSHLQSLLQSISDLHHCLQSLSITLNMPTRHNEGARPGTDSPTTSSLENLSIRGSAHKGQQLVQFLVREDSHKLAKVTLSDISLNQYNLKVLAKLPNLSCVRLQRTTHTDSHSVLTFDQDEFQKLKVLIVDSSDITKISFAGEFPELEKIFWSFHRHICISSTESLSGINMLQGLKELELIGDIAPVVDKSFKDYCDEMKIAYNHRKPENQNLPEGNNA